MAKTTKPKTKPRTLPTAKPAAKAPKPPTPARAPKAASTPAATTPPPAAPRWRDLTTDQLRATYREVLGRETASHDRAYLAWKVREAKAGRVPVGPAKGRVHHGPTTAVTIQFDEDLLTELDATATADGFPKRLPYLRDLLRRGLEVRGHAALAARFT